MTAARLRSLDVARCIAIVMMVLAHVRDGLISTEGNAHWLARLHDWTRGLTAPLFFIVSGWAFAAATVPRWPSFQVWGPGLRARTERIVTLFVVGKLLTLPWWHPGFPVDVPADVWVPFTASGVLECIALAMAVAHGLALLKLTPRTFAAVMLALTVAAVGLAAPVQAATAGWPLLLRGPFNTDGAGGGFALFPNGGYFWLGVAVGALWVTKPWSSATTLGLGAAAKLVALAVGGGGALFLSRGGWALLLLGALQLAVPAGAAMPKVELVARRAFTFYVVHMVALWGVPFVPGLVFLVQKSFSVFGVLGATAAILGGTAAALLAVDRWSPERGAAAVTR
ncbi:MAG: DUF1624 domain-containing protein [Myxococcaceae bacterium]|nr:DUF1624 domain-containing protein [Myxococcaceae bacterium]